MVVAATLLFGSLARADHSESSDTDLLMVSLEDDTRRVSVGRLSLFLYPWGRLMQDARDGDLFVCHLVREAKPLIDPEDYLSNLQATFRFRSNYREEIGRAADLGLYLARFGSDLNSPLLIKRALWCIRTILIARSADRRDPVFSPQVLAEQTRSAAARDLLCNRHNLADSDAVRRSLRQFLDFELATDSSLEQADRQSFIERFTETSNEVALQTLRQQEQSQERYIG